MHTLSIKAAEFMIKASNKGIAIDDILCNAYSISKDLSIKLCEQDLSTIRALSTSKFKQEVNHYDKEVINYFAKVVEDGRFLEQAFDDPFKVSGELGIQLSEGNIESIPRIPIDDIISPDDVQHGIGYILVLGFIIVILLSNSGYDVDVPPPVVDLSNLKKI